MAITTWQLVAAACCLLFETSSVLARRTENSIGGGNLPQSYTSTLDYESKIHPSLSSYGSATDLDASVFNTSPVSEVDSNFAPRDFNGADRQVQQEKVYQSTVSRMLAPSRQASTVQASTTTVGDLNTAAGHHHGHHHHGKYYEYREVPKPKTWKFGYKRGNHKHHIERHEHGKAGKHPHFKTKVKWADKKSKGKGIHLWDYNHYDKKHYHHHG